MTFHQCSFISYHWPLASLFSSLFRPIRMYTSKLCTTGHVPYTCLYCRTYFRQYVIMLCSKYSLWTIISGLEYVFMCKMPCCDDRYNDKIQLYIVWNMDICIHKLQTQECFHFIPHVPICLQTTSYTISKIQNHTIVWPNIAELFHSRAHCVLVPTFISGGDCRSIGCKHNGSIR